MTKEKHEVLLPALPEPFGVIGEYADEERDVWDYDQMRAYGQACAEAARQPAPVAIKTWQERKVSEGGMQNPGYKMWGERFYMVEEIAELRAALAATAAPMLSDAQKNVIRFAAEALEGLDYEDTAGDLRDILRSQP